MLAHALKAMVFSLSGNALCSTQPRVVISIIEKVNDHMEQADEPSRTSIDKRGLSMADPILAMNALAGGSGATIVAVEAYRSSLNAALVHPE